MTAAGLNKPARSDLYFGIKAGCSMRRLYHEIPLLTLCSVTTATRTAGVIFRALTFR